MKNIFISIYILTLISCAEYKEQTIHTKENNKLASGYEQTKQDTKNICNYIYTVSNRAIELREQGIERNNLTYAYLEKYKDNPDNELMRRNSIVKSAAYLAYDLKDFSSVGGAMFSFSECMVYRSGAATTEIMNKLQSDALECDKNNSNNPSKIRDCIDVLSANIINEYGKFLNSNVTYKSPYYNYPGLGKNVSEPQIAQCIQPNIPLFKEEYIEGVNININILLDNLGNIVYLNVFGTDEAKAKIFKDTIYTWKFLPSKINGQGTGSNITFTAKFYLGNL